MSSSPSAKNPDAKAAAWVRGAFYGAQVAFGISVGAAFVYLLWWLG
jgi:hypothetical protein